jgi:hypothetical protein
MDKVLQPLRQPKAIEADKTGIDAMLTAALIVLATVLVAGHVVPPLLRAIAFADDNFGLDYLVQVGQALAAAS